MRTGSRSSSNARATRRLVAAAVCAEQVIDLIDHGVQELHFYAMNRADLAFAICHLIGIRTRPAHAMAAAEAFGCKRAQRPAVNI